MKQPPSLSNQRSDFEKRKRQPFLFEKYYLNYQQFFLTELLQINSQNTKSNDGFPKVLSEVWLGFGDDLFDFLSLRYTAGEAIAELRSAIDEVLHCYEKASHFGRTASGDSHESALDLATIDHYVRYVGLLSLTILLHRQDLIPRVHALIAGSGFDKEDALVEELLTRYLPDRPYLDEWFHDEPYRYLLDATAGDTPDEKLGDLKTYLKKWYGGMKGTGWYGAHKGITDEGMGGYFGYWAWEAGAIAYLHNIDDSTIDSIHYPKDLVAFARSVSAPPGSTPQKSQQPERLRCEAGQPCPKSGLWSSPAYPDGKRRFQQGEVMPHIEGNAWGATIWHYAGE